MSSMGDKYQENLEKAVGPLIDGPLVVATIGSPVGAMSNLFRAEAFNVGMTQLDSSAMRVSGSTSGTVHQRDMKDVRLPVSFAVAVTATSVYFFKWKPFWGRVKIKKKLAELPRQGLKVKVNKGKASATVFLLLSEAAGIRTAFEMATLGRASAQAKAAEVTGALAPETI
jgi:hypothetical protein